MKEHRCRNTKGFTPKVNVLLSFCKYLSCLLSNLIQMSCAAAHSLNDLRTTSNKVNPCFGVQTSTQQIFRGYIWAEAANNNNNWYFVDAFGRQGFMASESSSGHLDMWPGIKPPTLVFVDIYPTNCSTVQFWSAATGSLLKVIAAKGGRSSY